MSKRIKMEIKGEKESAADFVKAWRRAERKMPPETPKERIYFKDLATLLAAMTPKRMELLQALRAAGPLSVRALAKVLGRDYKNTHGDTKALELLGLILRDSQGLLHVPWSSIMAEMALAA
jgi:predicted transcriptional regulator